MVTYDKKIQSVCSALSCLLTKETDQGKDPISLHVLSFSTSFLFILIKLIYNNLIVLGHEEKHRYYIKY